jgi:hypothetical protein
MWGDAGDEFWRAMPETEFMVIISLIELMSLRIRS